MNCQAFVFQQEEPESQELTMSTIMSRMQPIYNEN